MSLYLFAVLSLVEKISGKRGRGTIVKLLRGGKSKSVLSLKKGDDAPDNRYSGIMAKVPNNKILAIFDELLKGGRIEIVEDMFMGKWYPLVYITGKGRDTLKEKE